MDESRLFSEKIIGINEATFDNPKRFSTIGMLLRSARKLSGRDLFNGDYLGNELHDQIFMEDLFIPNQFSSLIFYLIILEQIGILFEKKDSTSNRQNGIYLSLLNFSELHDDEIESIVGLRNSLTHNFGLAMKNTDKKKRSHKFILTMERNNQIVDVSKKIWDGDFSEKGDDYSTTIHVIDLMALVENIFTRLKEEIKDGCTLLKISQIEAEARFTIIS